MIPEGRDLNLMKKTSSGKTESIKAGVAPFDIPRNKRDRHSNETQDYWLTKKKMVTSPIKSLNRGYRPHLW